MAQSLSNDVGRAIKVVAFDQAGMDPYFGGGPGVDKDIAVGNSFDEVGLRLGDGGRGLIRPLGPFKPLRTFPANGRSRFVYELILDLLDRTLDRTSLIQGITTQLMSFLGDGGSALHTAFAALTSPNPSADLNGGHINITYEDPVIVLPTVLAGGGVAGAPAHRPLIVSRVVAICWHAVPMTIS